MAVSHAMSGGHLLEPQPYSLSVLRLKHMVGSSFSLLSWITMVQITSGIEFTFQKDRITMPVNQEAVMVLSVY